MKTATYIHITLLCALTLLFVKCQNAVDIDFVDFIPQLVLDGQLSPDEYFEISVMSTVVPDATETGEVNSRIEVSLWDLTVDREISLFREDNRFVSLTERPIQGHTYEVVASSTNYEDAVARTTIPEDLQLLDYSISNFSIEPSKVTPFKNNISYRLDLDFNQQEESAVHVRFYQKSRLNVGSITEPDYKDLVFEVIPIFPEEMGYSEHFDGGILIDLNSGVEDGLVQLEFREFTLEAVEQLGELIIEVRSISQEYIKYYETLSQQIIARQDPFAEPVSVFSNVEGGLGVFGSFQSSRYALTLY